MSKHRPQGDQPRQESKPTEDNTREDQPQRTIKPEPQRNNPTSEEEVLARTFLADDLIPDAAAAFRYKAPAIEEAIRTADVVLDTNVLLLPYGAGSGSLAEIIKVLTPLAKNKRLFLPTQVAREFIRNRPNKIGELQQQLQDKISRFISLEKLNFPILEGNQQYAKLNETIEKTSALKKELGQASAEVVKNIKSWEWNDPVSKAFRTLFDPSAIISPPVDRTKVLAELRRRQSMQIPPGYKDAGKDDLGVGDLLIWLTVLELGTSNKKPLILVSGDEKPDWQHRSGGAGFLPRYELLDEYRRASDGKAFYMIPLSRLLELLNAPSESVDQIKHEEVRIQEASILLVSCPICENIVGTRLGALIGSSSHPRCAACETLLHVHRTRSGILVNSEDGVPIRKSVTELTQEEDVTCPACGSWAKALLGLERNATRWCNCEACEERFPIHRRADGGIRTGRVAGSRQNDIGPMNNTVLE